MKPLLWSAQPARQVELRDVPADRVGVRVVVPSDDGGPDQGAGTVFRSLQFSPSRACPVRKRQPVYDRRSLPECRDIERCSICAPPHAVLLGTLARNIARASSIEWIEMGIPTSHDPQGPPPVR